ALTIGPAAIFATPFPARPFRLDQSATNGYLSPAESVNCSTGLPHGRTRSLASGPQVSTTRRAADWRSPCGPADRCVPNSGRSRGARRHLPASADAPERGEGDRRPAPVRLPRLDV